MRLHTRKSKDHLDTAVMTKIGSSDVFYDAAPAVGTTTELIEVFKEKDPTGINSDKIHSGNNIDGADLIFNLSPLKNREELRISWQLLEEECGSSLFQSWGWIDSWLGVLPPEVEPFVLTAHRFGKMCGIALIFRTDQWRHGWLLSKGLFLNETGVPTLDALTVEYNGILCDSAEAPDLTVKAFSYLKKALHGWDEFVLSGIDNPTAAAFQNSEDFVNIASLQPCHYVDLSEIRGEGTDYIDCLSRNTRSQLRRAMRRYEKRGALSAVSASTVEQALEFFEEMRILHQNYWQSRGQPGAFAKPTFEAFHSDFIKSQFSAKRIEMLRITAGEYPIGYLYNIVHRGRVHNYQSGFVYEKDSAMKPGIVSHYLAIERNLGGPALIYDFMAGNGQHKKSLGTASQEMVWLIVSQPRLKYRLERGMRKLKQRWTATRSK